MKTLDDVIRLSLPAGRGIVKSMARDIRRAIARYRPAGGNLLLVEVRQIINSYLPGFGAAFGDGLLAAWVSAARIVADVAEDEPRVIELTKPIEPVRYPGIEKAMDWIGSRGLVGRDELADVRRETRREALIVGHGIGEQVVDRLRAAIVEAAENGSDVRAFLRENVDVGLESHELESLYRTNLGQFYKEGQLAMLDNPLIGDEFPYVLYSATHDGRTRPEHLEMERLGLNGTSIYRVDDPVIRKFWPPWSWSCRCGAILISVEDAARYGVREARRWLKNGRPPAEPEFVQHPPFDLPPGWPAQ